MRGQPPTEGPTCSENAEKAARGWPPDCARGPGIAASSGPWDSLLCEAGARHLPIEGARRRCLSCSLNTSCDFTARPVNGCKGADPSPPKSSGKCMLRPPCGAAPSCRLAPPSARCRHGAAGMLPPAGGHAQRCTHFAELGQCLFNLSICLYWGPAVPVWAHTQQK